MTPDSQVDETLDQISYRLNPIPPFRLDLTVWALRRRPDNIIDRWDGQTYRRALAIKGNILGLEVVQAGNLESPEIEVTVSGNLPARKLKQLTAGLVERMLGFQIDLNQFYDFAHGDKSLKLLVEQFRGVKPPRFSSLFEALLNSISCQQISLTFCVRLLNRLVETWGPAATIRGLSWKAFPQPSNLAGAEPEMFRQMGYSYNKARAILEASSQIDKGELNLDQIARLNDTEAIAALMKLRGVGRWTAEYTLLRGDGRTHLFPPGDSGALGNLRRWLSPDKLLSPQEIQAVLTSWGEYAGLVYYHLLLKRLSEAGYLDGAI